MLDLGFVAEVGFATGGVGEEFADEVAGRWDSQQLRADVIATQKQRRAIHAAMEAGAAEPWDYNPPRDASREYVRNNMDWTVAAERFRFPKIGQEGQ